MQKKKYINFSKYIIPVNIDKNDNINSKMNLNNKGSSKPLNHSIIVEEENTELNKTEIKNDQSNEQIQHKIEGKMKNNDIIIINKKIKSSLPKKNIQNHSEKKN